MDERTESFAAEGVCGIRMKLECAAFVMETSETADRIQLSIANEGAGVCKYGVKDGVLEIKYRTPQRLFRSNFNTPSIGLIVPCGCEFETFRMEIGAGSADLTKAEIAGEKIRLETGAGKIRAGSLRARDVLRVEIGAGSMELSGIRARDVKAECGMGDLKLCGIVEQNLTAECGMGTCRMDLKGNEADYNYDISCGMGSVKVNGNSCSSVGSSQRIKKTDAAGLIKLSCGMGKVEFNLA